jgi:hypothetical protein
MIVGNSFNQTDPINMNILCFHQQTKETEAQE